MSVGKLPALTFSLNWAENCTSNSNWTMTFKNTNSSKYPHFKFGNYKILWNVHSILFSRAFSKNSVIMLCDFRKSEVLDRELLNKSLEITLIGVGYRYRRIGLSGPDENQTEKPAKRHYSIMVSLHWSRSDAEWVCRLSKIQISLMPQGSQPPL